MSLYNISLEDFKTRRRHLDLVLRLDKPHQALEYNRPIEVYCEDIIFDGHKTWFWLFDNNKFVGNPISFPSEIKHQDKQQIANDMINELLTKSDFRDLDLELQGKVPCEEHRDDYKSCKECKLHIYNDDYVECNDGCMGSMYSIPDHMNSWDTEDKWNEKYGCNTENHKIQLMKKALNEIRNLMINFKDDKNVEKELIKYIKNF